MNAAFCYKQLKTGSVLFPRTDFVVRCAPQKVIPTPTDVYVTNIGALPIRVFFTFDYPMKGTDYFNFIVTNLTNQTQVTLRYQPAIRYIIGGLIVENEYTVAVQAVVDEIPRGISVATEPFSPGYGILQFTKRLVYIAETDSVNIPSVPPAPPIAQRTALAVCTDNQNNFLATFADASSRLAYVVKYTNTGTRLFLAQIARPTNFIPYAIATDSNSDIYVAGYEIRADEFTSLVSPAVVKLSGADGSSIRTSSNYELFGGYFTGIKVTANAVFLSGFTVSDIGIVQSFILSKNLILQDLAFNRRPTESDPDAGDISVARAICIDSLGRPIIVGYTQTSDQVTTSYFMSIYDPTTLERLLYFKKGATAKQTIGESVAVCPDGGVVICGSTSAQLDSIGFVGTGGLNAFVSKYNFSTYTNDQLRNFNGTLPLNWTKLVGSTDLDTTFTQGLGTAVDGQGGIYVVGETTGGIGTFSQMGGISDLFIIKYDASGNQKYLYQNGSTNFLPFVSTTFSTSIATNSNNDFFIGGVSDGIRYDQLLNLAAPAGAYVPGIFVSKYSATL
jgi:hypothetical protein